MVLIDDLNNCHVTDVWIDGDYVAKDGSLINDIGIYTYPDDATHSVHLDLKKPSDFEILHDGDKVKARVIEVIPAKTSTIEKFVDLDVKDGKVVIDPSKDVLKAFVFERHHETGTFGIGFIKGFGIKNGALAQTVTHDAHNLIVVGTNNEDMALAANELIKCGGGLVAVRDGKVLGKVELPIAGIMSDQRYNLQKT